MRVKGFTLIELLVVIAVLGVLASVVIIELGNVREKAYFSSAKSGLEQLSSVFRSYAISRGTYPPDVGRGLPPDILYELQGGSWPAAPWPGSVYDWDTWVDSGTGLPVYQISIRFCQPADPSTCRFPDEPWAKDFQVDSAVYYCIQGPCKAQVTHPADYPGYCVNC